MSTDVEGVMDGTRDFHDVWISVFELVTGLCLLSTMIGKAVFLPIIPICGKRSKSSPFKTHPINISA